MQKLTLGEPRHKYIWIISSVYFAYHANGSYVVVDPHNQIPMRLIDKHYLCVYNTVNKKFYYYCFQDGIYIPKDIFIKMNQNINER